VISEEVANINLYSLVWLDLVWNAQSTALEDVVVHIHESYQLCLIQRLSLISHSEDEFCI